MLKAVYKNQEDIPAGYEDLYTEKNGQFELTGVEGIKTQADVSRVQDSLSKERAAHKATKEAFKALDGMDLQEVIANLDRIPELEAQAAAAGGNDPAKVDAMVESRIKSRLAPLERERDQLKTQNSELSGRVEEFENISRTRTVHDSVREAATKLNILPSAIDDALMLADHNLQVSEDGQVVVKEGVKGFTESVDVGTWLTEVRDRRPHWWPASEGGGANGGSPSATGNNPWSKKHWNMTEQGRVYRENPTRAENLAKAAGTVLGGPQPEK